MVMAWLVNSMEKKLGKLYLCYETAKQIWDLVTESYSDSAQVFEIRSSLRDQKQGNLSVTDYYNLLMGLWQSLDMFTNVKWKCGDDGTQYMQMLDKEQVFDFLYGLNNDLDEVRGRLLGTKPLESVWCLLKFAEDLILGKTIGSAREHEDLYYLENIYSPMNKQALASGRDFDSVSDTIMLWHFRLGHPSFSYLKRNFPSLLINKDEFFSM